MYKYKNLDQLIYFNKKIVTIDDLIKIAAIKNILSIQKENNLSDEELFEILISQPDYNKKLKAINDNFEIFKDEVLPSLEENSTDINIEDIKQQIPELINFNTIQEMGSFVSKNKNQNPDLFNKWIEVNKQLKNKSQNTDNKYSELRSSGENIEWYLVNKDSIISNIKEHGDVQFVYHLMFDIYEIFNKKNKIPVEKLESEELKNYDILNKSWNQFTLDELIDIKTKLNYKLSEEGQKTKNKASVKNAVEGVDYKFVKNIDNVEFYVPLTKKGSCYLANYHFPVKATWCTGALTDNNMFDSYSSRGTLYIIYDKDSNMLVQYFTGSGEFKDASNNPVLLSLLSLTLNNKKEARNELYNMTKNKVNNSSIFNVDSKDDLKDSSIREASSFIRRQEQLFYDERMLESAMNEQSSGIDDINTNDEIKKFLNDLMDYYFNYYKDSVHVANMIDKNFKYDITETLLSLHDEIDKYATYGRDINNEVKAISFDISKFPFLPNLVQALV